MTVDATDQLAVQQATRAIDAGRHRSDAWLARARAQRACPRRTRPALANR